MAVGLVQNEGFRFQVSVFSAAAGRGAVSQIEKEANERRIHHRRRKHENYLVFFACIRLPSLFSCLTGVLWWFRD